MFMLTSIDNSLGSSECTIFNNESMYKISMFLFLLIYSAINICQHKFGTFSFVQVNCIHC